MTSEIKKVDLSVVVVSYNTADILEKCIAAVNGNLAKSAINGEIIVVDNDSDDDSVMTAKRLGAKVVSSGENLGFGKANNRGANLASGKCLLFLNSDTIVENKVLEEMVKFMDLTPNIGIASCNLKNADQSPQPQGGYLPSLFTILTWALFLDDLPILKNVLPSYQLKINYDRVTEVGWVGGTAMFVKRECWEKMGGFDEEIFMYGEDVELCYRASKKGWKIMVNPKVSIVHLKGGSANGKPEWVTGEVKGLLHLLSKHKTVVERRLIRTVIRLGMGARWLIFGILGGNEKLGKAYLEAMALA